MRAGMLMTALEPYPGRWLGKTALLKDKSSIELNRSYGSEDRSSMKC